MSSNNLENRLDRIERLLRSLADSVEDVKGMESTLDDITLQLSHLQGDACDIKEAVVTDSDESDDDAIDQVDTNLSDSGANDQLPTDPTDCDSDDE